MNKGTAKIFVPDMLRRAMAFFAAFPVLACFCGCATNGRPDMRGLSVEKVIERLNESPRQNAEARKVLVIVGGRAIPLILKEIDRPADELLHARNSLRAMRALRVLREMDTPAGLPVCKKLLLRTYFRPTMKHDAALLNEALAYVYDRFPREDAKDIYVSFVTGDPRRYMKELRHAEHWSPTIYSQRIEIDVLTGLYLLADSEDTRLKEAVTALMENAAGGSRKGGFCRLGDDGFAITDGPQPDSDHPGSDR